ncbi:Gfo/Idh/MocA family oxidoreductase [Rhodocytophaga rosea]|uniref:Gfo/Idh/MocA family oxidoreductase n=1 Tax=Rhodocytophaga rosea TaxID=2704465 RepID=A0A6C0GHD5_9BACT|nr:Gfo/Idh/MocA family oxidoreductase [Rhodocytophaga rosea]QHT67446.1 Gfo/Idh/MocA family oxidoreductase [Rhodocytophaga rosea]
MKQINWGIIGTGDVTEVKSGPAFNKIAGSKLVAVMRRDAEKAADYARRHGVHTWYSDAQQLINDPQVNAVYIATPPSSHAEYTKLAAAAGKPVYVEKPMAMNYEECTRMIEACEEANVPLFVAYYRRCLPNFVKIKELLNNGTIGEIRCVNIRLFFPPPAITNGQIPWRINPSISGGGIFYDLAPHQLDLLDYWFGPITAATGMAANQSGVYAAEDIVSAIFSFSNGVLGTGLWCFTVDKSQQTDQGEIIGSKGRITFSFFDLAVPVRVETGSQTDELTFTMPVNVQHPLIQTIVEELQGTGKCPSTGVSGARTAKVMDDIMGEWYKQQKREI